MTNQDEIRAEEPTVDSAHELISTLRVEGTPVFDRERRRIGSVHSLMVGKVDGRVRYAVVSFAGILGIGAHYHPIPWELLHYETDLGGYAVEMSAEQLRNAPTLTLDETDHPVDREREKEMTSHWKTMPWWGL
jgi:hypothetical protein